MTYRVSMFGAYNFRPIVAGSRTRRPQVYRSGQLWLSTPGARRRMARLGITLVIDLRSGRTAMAFPDRPIPQAVRRTIDLIGQDDVLDLVGADLMTGRYRQLVVNPGQRARLAEVLRAVADHEGGVLVHCTDGKDRTGWIAALLQHIGGDDRRAVEEAYLASRSRIRFMVAARFLADLVTGGLRKARERRPINVVDALYLTSALDAVAEQFGSLDAYLREGLGLDTATLARLRAKVA